MMPVGAVNQTGAILAANQLDQSVEPNAAIHVLDLWKRYGTVEAVRGISLEISPGEIFGLIGPDGAGRMIYS